MTTKTIQDWSRAEETGLQVVHSYVHSSPEKVTSLTISVPKNKDKCCFFTLSDKVNKIRVKMSLDEIAGLAEAVDKNRQWDAYHSWEDADRKTETRLQYNNGFFNGQREGNKIALKLTDDEKASFKRVLETIFSRLCNF